MDEQEIIQQVKNWLQSFVIDLNLCPFARRELAADNIRFVVSQAQSENDLTLALDAELTLLTARPEITTTLLVHPRVLSDFYDYNNYLNDADALLQAQQLEGVYQIASFHPHYQFAHTHPDDAENYSNRAPYPLLHILREDTVANAIDSYPEIDESPANNIARLNQIGSSVLKSMWLANMS
jgi:hypothetical protein